MHFGGNAPSIRQISSWVSLTTDRAVEQPAISALEGRAYPGGKKPSLESWSEVRPNSFEMRVIDRKDWATGKLRAPFAGILHRNSTGIRCR
jgi:hypothetical protein